MAIIRNKWFLSLLLLCEIQLLYAQSNRYMILFTDKDQTPYTIDKPDEFLSERAILRKARFNIDISAQDLPVDPAYVQQLRNIDVDVFFTSKWFNGALVQMPQSKINTVNRLSFVDSLIFVAKGELLTYDVGDYEIAEIFEDPINISANTDIQLSMIDADAMHADGYRGKNILIAVFDAGFEGVNQYKPFEHIHREGRFIAGWDFISNSKNVFQFHDHGTKVLSTIAAEYGNFSGVAPESDYILCVTEDVKHEYKVEEYNWLFAAEFADSCGVDIIHTSLGYSTFDDASMDYTYDNLDGQTAIITRVANIAMDKGILVVTSAGNEGKDSWKYITAPADADGILTVGSITSSNKLSSFSSIGPTSDGRIKPDVVALGTQTAVISKSGSIYNANGTSYAAPLITGLAAGVWESNPDWTNRGVANAIRFTASQSQNPDSSYGYGIPSYKRAVADRVLSVSDMLANKVTVYPNPFTDGKIYIEVLQSLKDYPLEISVFDANGSLMIKNTLNEPVVDNIIELNLNVKIPGIYFLKINSKEYSKHVKLIGY